MRLGERVGPERFLLASAVLLPSAFSLEILVFAALGVALVLFDCRYQVLPDLLTFALFAAGLVRLSVGQGPVLLDASTGVLLGGGLLWLVRALYARKHGREGMGFLDNQSARLQVGDEVPVVTETETDSDDSSITTTSVAFKETGVTLEVTPRVNSSGLVTQEILQETSNVVGESANGTLTPTISQRAIESSIAVQDGSTILLGGMIQESNSAGKVGVPVVSDLPGVGALFGSRTNGVSRTELIVLLTPRVVRNPNEVRVASEEMRMRLQNMRPQFFPRDELTQLGNWATSPEDG